MWNGLSGERFTSLGKEGKSLRLSVQKSVTTHDSPLCDPPQRVKTAEMNAAMRRPRGSLELGRYRKTVKGEELVQVGEFVVPRAISRVGGMHLHKGHGRSQL